MGWTVVQYVLPIHHQVYIYSTDSINLVAEELPVLPNVDDLRTSHDPNDDGNASQQRTKHNSGKERGYHVGLRQALTWGYICRPARIVGEELCLFCFVFLRGRGRRGQHLSLIHI